MISSLLIKFRPGGTRGGGEGRLPQSASPELQSRVRGRKLVVAGINKKLFSLGNTCLNRFILCFGL